VGTQSKSTLVKPEISPIVTCDWRTGAARCAMRVSSGLRCQWHAHWVRLVDAGNLGRQQKDEFAEWWEQFQPYGIYGDRPGQWWAALDVLWAAMTGCADAPVLTASLELELYTRRAEVGRYKQGLAWPDHWQRLSGPPLPPWERSLWQPKVAMHGVRSVGHAEGAAT